MALGDLVGKFGWPPIRRIGVVILTLLLAAGCGAPSAATSHAAPSPPVAHPGAPHQLVPRPLMGQALSVLQMGTESWLAVKTPHGIVVTMAQGQRRTESTVPSAATCSAAGALQAAGSTPLVMGCTQVWLRHNHRWVPTKLPADLGGRQDFIVDGSQWWLLGFGAGASGGEGVTLWHSPNAGGTWDLVAGSGHGLTSQPPGSLPYYGDKTGLAASPAQDLWLTGSMAGEGAVWLYRAAPGGKTWTAVSPAVPQAWWLAQLTSYPPVWASARQGYLPVAVDGTQFTGIAVYAASGSKTPWALAAALPAPAVMSSSLSLAASAPGSVWITIGRNLWASADGGRDWRVTWRLTPGWTFAAISFSGRNNGALLATRRQGTTFAYAAWQTANGGRTWTNRIEDRSTGCPLRPIS